MADDKQEPDDEFERFENLTRRLLAVRKADIDRHRDTDKDPPERAVGDSKSLG